MKIERVDGTRLIKVAEKHTVQVTHVKSRHKNGLAIILISACCGEHTEKHTWTIGADDGIRPEPDSITKLQEKFDKMRESVAHEAAWKVESHAVADQLV